MRRVISSSEIGIGVPVAITGWNETYKCIVVGATSATTDHCIGVTVRRIAANTVSVNSILNLGSIGYLDTSSLSGFVYPTINGTLTVAGGSGYINQRIGIVRLVDASLGVIYINVEALGPTTTSGDAASSSGVISTITASGSNTIGHNIQQSVIVQVRETNSPYRQVDFETQLNDESVTIYTYTDTSYTVFILEPEELVSCSGSATITHSLATENLIVQVHEDFGNYRIVSASIDIVDASTIDIAVGTNNNYVVMLRTATGTSLTHNQNTRDVFVQTYNDDGYQTSPNILYDTDSVVAEPLQTKTVWFKALNNTSYLRLDLSNNDLLHGTLGNSSVDAVFNTVNGNHIGRTLLGNGTGGTTLSIDPYYAGTTEVILIGTGHLIPDYAANLITDYTEADPENGTITLEQTMDINQPWMVFGVAR